MTIDAEWELDRRRSWQSLFDAMEQYHEQHPDASDDECFEAVVWHNHKEPAHEQH